MNLPRNIDLLPQAGYSKTVSAAEAFSELTTLLKVNQDNRIAAIEAGGRAELDVRRDAPGAEEQLSDLRAKTNAKVDLLRQQEDALNSRRDDLAYLSTCIYYLNDAHQRGVRFRHCAATPRRLKANESAEAIVAEIRLEVAHVANAIEAATVARQTAVELKAWIEREVDAVARPIALNPRHQSGNATDLASRLTVVGAAGAIAGLFGDQIVARLHRLVDETDLSGAITAAERSKALAQLSARKLELERVEEATIMAAAAIGQVIVRRAAADPRAVLEVEEVAT